MSQETDDQGRQGAVLVTAGASGIGRIIATAYRDAGWSVHVCDIDAAAIERFQSEVQGVSVSIGNVADPDAADRVVAEMVERYGRLGVLVNNAGIAGKTGLAEEIDTEDWRRTLNVNIDGTFFFARAAIPHLKAGGGGAIINMSSTAGLFGFPLRAAYSASKWAVIGLTKTLAMELGPHNIRVNAICPGSVEGPRIDGVIERDAAARGVTPDAVRETYERQVSMRCFVRPDDIADMCLFLSSAAGSRISGQALAIDGHTESLSFPL